MPLPIPKKGESQSDFASRCIDFETHASPGRDAKQIQAMCFDRFREFRGGSKLAFFLKTGTFLSEGGKVWRKPILAFGVWKHPENRNVEFEITKDIVLQIIKNFKDGVPVEAPVVLTHTDDPKAKVGVIKEFVMTPQGLDAVLSVDDDEMNASIANEDKAPGVSCWLDLEYQDKKTNAELGAVVKHVALVNHPYIEGLGGWQTVSLSDDDKEDFVPLILSEEKIDSGGLTMPGKDDKKKTDDKKFEGLTKEVVIEFLKEKEKVDVAALLSSDEELKTLHDRIDKGELVAKDDADAVLTEDLMKKIKDELKLGDEKAKASDIVEALLAKFVEMSGITKDVSGLKKQLSEMQAEKEIDALLAEGYALPAEKPVLTKIFLSDSKLFEEMAKSRRDAGKKLVDLSEDGITETEQEKLDERKKEVDETLKRNIEAGQEEGRIALPVKVA